MKDRMDLSRRAFLIGSAAIAGGVAFGPPALAQDMAPPLPQGAPAGSARINPWVVIGPDRITVVAPHADVGQGVASVQAALIAEELDVDLDQPELSFGPVDPEPTARLLFAAVHEAADAIAGGADHDTTLAALKHLLRRTLAP